MEDLVFGFYGLFCLFCIISFPLGVFYLYFFIRSANDLHFLRKEYENLKRIHRLGEYSLIKGKRIYQIGEKLYCEELKTKVTITGITDKGLYICESGAGQGTYYGKTYHIAGDKLSELPKEEA